MAAKRKRKAAPKRDAKLISLARKLERAEKIVKMAYDDATLDKALGAYNAIVDQIIAARVTTVQGIKAKAAALASVYTTTAARFDDNDEQDATLSRQIVASLLMLADDTRKVESKPHVASPSPVTKGFDAVSAPVTPSADFIELRRLAAELSVVIDHWDNAPPGDPYWHEQLMAATGRTHSVCARIHSRPVRGMSDLLDRAAVVLHMSNGSWLPGVWDDPVAHLRGLSLELDPSEDREQWAAVELAAAVFSMTGTALKFEERVA
ncbi:hypothetical protein [Hyphomicrobium sp. D-2]|uniref:hypothetical protein n=1 Tax=Hyphomicrobium sp. D-2 TaxID=3041621 RepID=UPI0024542B7F|nr:hypothetical protein [Hyphomicrobium sp. D-2]MDH4981247.1 hypothetical protein [Hyphomicrobium sp. D-2]